MVTISKWAAHHSLETTIWAEGRITSTRLAASGCTITIADDQATLTCWVPATVSPPGPLAIGTSVSAQGHIVIRGTQCQARLNATQIVVKTPPPQATASDTADTPNKRLKWPTTVRSVALIRPARGLDGTTDFLQTLKPAVHGLTIKELPTPMSTPADARRIAEQIINAADGHDIIAIVRGGGHGLDLFNSPLIASAIDTSPIPVICGIGHATDTTCTDQHAHHTAITPTALAAWLGQRISKRLPLAP